jgi:hypothetical protein
MADGEVTGITELIQRFDTLPTRLKQRVLRGWATAQGNRMAAMMRPGIQAVAFKTGRLVGSIRGKAVRAPKALSIFGAIARAIAYSSSKHGGYAFNPLNAGTKPRYTKGGIARDRRGRFSVAGSIQRAVGARAYRGRVTPRRFIAGMAPHIHAMVGPVAEEDLAKRIERALAKNGG